MTTSKRRVPTWLLPIVAFVAVLGIGLGVTYLLTDGDDKTTSGTTPTPAAKASKKADPLPPHKSVVVFDRLTLPLLKGWESLAASGAPETSRDYVDARRCDQSEAVCPHFAVHNLKDPYFSEGTDGTKPFGPLLSDCGAGDPAAKNTITIDGEKAQHYEFDCSGSPAHVWVVPGKSVEFASFAGETVALDTKAVTMMVKGVTWK